MSLEHPQDINEFLRQNEQRSLLRFSTAGSVDDGKSTLIGRLLHDSKAIFEDTLAAIKNSSSQNVGKENIDFSLVTDGLKAEREQKITIDVAYRYFSTPKRNFILADTPGHEQYTRNMATGASTANAAIILIDAKHGVLTQTKRHSFICTLLGIKHILVAVNKMDAVDYSEDVFNDIRRDYLDFANKLGIPDLHFTPISALCGDNVVNRSENMPWYTGSSVMEYLENLYVGGDLNLIDFRMPVQYVIRPDQTFRGFSGQISSGVVRVGDEVITLPSMKKSKVKTITTFDGDLKEAYAPMSVTITLEDEIDISRGDILVHPNNIPHKENSVEAMVVWMSETPMDPNRPYLVKHTTSECKGRIENLRYRVDVNTLSRAETSGLQLNEIGRIKLKTQRPLFYDVYKRNPLTGSFVLIDTVTNATMAAGMIIDRIPEEDLKPILDEDIGKKRNIRKEVGAITREEREKRSGHKARTIWLTGLSGSGKSSIAISLEEKLFGENRNVYRLDGDNIRFGLNKDLDFSKESRAENIRRISEVAKLMNDAGVSVITAFISPFKEDRDLAKSIIGEESFKEIYVNTPLDVCEKRDVKGLYKKARAGVIPEFTGISSPYEEPDKPALSLNTDELSLEECVQKLLDLLKK